MKSAVGDQLKDPMSAIYSGVERVPRADGAKVACGWVNAKNSFGGYSGKQRFAAINYHSDLPLVTLGEQQGAAIEKTCAPQTEVDLVIERARQKLQAKFDEEDARDPDVDALCSRMDFTYVTSTWCGQLHNKCWEVSKNLGEDDKSRFMQICRRRGLDAATSDFDNELKAARGGQ